MRGGFAATFLFLVLALGTGPASAQCGRLALRDIRAVDWQGGTGSTYDVFDASEYGQTVTFRVTKSRGGTCSYVVGISQGGASGFDPRQLVGGKWLVTRPAL